MVAAEPVSIQSPAGIRIAKAPSIATSGVIPKENGPLDRMGRVVPFNRGSELYSQLEPANYLYQLISGVAQAYRLTADGHRQIVAFYLPGDLFGFEVGKNHTLSVEAITYARVRLIRSSTIMAAALTDEEVAHQLWISLAHEVRRNQEHISRLSKTARERVADFLWEMSKRFPNDGTVELPMSRLDMADYLGITIETVSRMLTRLMEMSVIKISRARKITIQDPGLLKRLAT
jgi:CRP/FNR family transcriptional regulator, nitrogen fixation regulation protein